VEDWAFRELLDKLDAAIKEVDRLQLIVKKETGGKEYVPGGRFYENHKLEREE
jgi:hypothetical protein